MDDWVMCACEGVSWRGWVRVSERTEGGTGAGAAIEEGLLEILLEDGERGQVLEFEGALQGVPVVCCCKAKGGTAQVGVESGSAGNGELDVFASPRVDGFGGYAKEG